MAARANTSDPCRNLASSTVPSRPMSTRRARAAEFSFKYGNQVQANHPVTVGFQKAVDRIKEETGGRVEYPLQGLYSDISGYLSTPSDEGNYAIQVGTGGYTAELSSAIFRSVASLSGDITTQYVIRYTPDVGPASEARQFRRIKVSVNLPGVQLRYRNGYYPFAPPN